MAYNFMQFGIVMWGGIAVIRWIIHVIALHTTTTTKSGVQLKRRGGGGLNGVCGNWLHKVGN